MSIHVVHVEDEKSLRTILAIAFRLSEPDIQLHQFVSGDEALPYIESNGQTVDLFILDIRLPGTLNGLQLAQKIRELGCPGFIVLTSAYSEPSAAVIASVRCEYYPKPWHILELTPKLLTFRLDKRPSAPVMPPGSASAAITSPVVSPKPVFSVPTPPAKPETPIHRQTNQHAISQAQPLLYTCPICHYRYPLGEPYCPNCGAGVADTKEEHTVLMSGVADLSRQKDWAKGQIVLNDQQGILLATDGDPVVLPTVPSVILGCLEALSSAKMVILDLTAWGALDKGVSRRHLQIRRIQNIVYVNDMGSTNGSWLNGRRLVPHSRYIVRDGDELYLGKFRMKVKFQNR
jgi:CheY-like chemotaxis protein